MGTNINFYHTEYNWDDLQCFNFSKQNITPVALL